MIDPARQAAMCEFSRLIASEFQAEVVKRAINKAGRGKQLAEMTADEVRLAIQAYYEDMEMNVPGDYTAMEAT